MPDAHDTDIGIFKIRNLYWVNDINRDVIAAAQFIAYRVVSGERIGVYDAYLKADGTLDVWEDATPDHPDSVEPDYVRPHPDWTEVIKPLLSVALEASVTR